MRQSDFENDGFGRHVLQQTRRSAICAAVASALTLIATPSSGLSLLEARVHSHLGQQLVADIPYTVAAGEYLTSSCIRAGVPGPYSLPALKNLRFSIDRARNAIAVTTAYQVREPLASLIVEVACPGTPAMVREYTISLDPPVLRREASAATVERSVTVPTVQAPAASRQVRPTEPQREGQPSKRDINAGTSYRVQVGDTLSTIAFRVRQRAPNTTWQWAKRIHTQNPSAFIDGDMNRLKAGSHLTIPGSDSPRAVAARADEPSQSARHLATATSPASAAQAQAKEHAAPTQTEEGLRNELARLERERRALDATLAQKTVAIVAATDEVKDTVQSVEDTLQSPEEPAPADSVDATAAVASTPAAEPTEKEGGPGTMIAALAVTVTGILGVLLLAFGMGRRRAYSRSANAAPVPARKTSEKVQPAALQLESQDMPAFDDTMTVVEIAMPSPTLEAEPTERVRETIDEDVETNIAATPITANELAELFAQNGSTEVTSLSASQTARLPDSAEVSRSLDDTASLSEPVSQEDTGQPRDSAGNEPTQKLALDATDVAGQNEGDVDTDTVEAPVDALPSDDKDTQRRDKAVGEE